MIGEQRLSHYSTCIQSRKVRRACNRQQCQSAYPGKCACNGYPDCAPRGSVGLASTGGHILPQRVDEDGQRKRGVPADEQPPRAVYPITNKTVWGVRTWKSKRLQKREQSAGYIAACEYQNGTSRLNSILSKQ